MKHMEHSDLERARASFAEALRNAYLRDPSGVLPNAFWKTRSEIASCCVAVEGSADDPAGLLMWDSEKLLVSWSPGGHPPGRMGDVIRTVDVALIPDRMADRVDLSTFSDRTAYFRLTHGLAAESQSPSTSGDRAVQVRMPEEAAQVASFIGRCYERIRPSADEVRSWTERQVYDPRFWVWIRRDGDGQAVALGIADLDQSIGEVSLEWIQVAPDHRRCGLGSVVVNELLRRARGVARFATVSGQNGSPAESLYRSCGFEGTDLWWCLRSSVDRSTGGAGAEANG